MPGGVLVGILRVRHADHLVLHDGTQVFLTGTQTAREFPIGTSLTVAYTLKKDGRKIVFVHTTPEHFEAREVEVLEGVGPQTAVRRGLAVGERIVVTGGYPLLSAPVAGRTR